MKVVIQIVCTMYRLYRRLRALLATHHWVLLAQETGMPATVEPSWVRTLFTAASTVTTVPCECVWQMEIGMGQLFNAIVRAITTASSTYNSAYQGLWGSVSPCVYIWSVAIKLANRYKINMFLMQVQLQLNWLKSLFLSRWEFSYPSLWFWSPYSSCLLYFTSLLSARRKKRVHGSRSSRAEWWSYLLSMKSWTPGLAYYCTTVTIAWKKWWTIKPIVCQEKQHKKLLTLRLPWVKLTRSCALLVANSLFDKLLSYITHTY